MGDPGPFTCLFFTPLSTADFLGKPFAWWEVKSWRILRILVRILNTKICKCGRKSYFHTERNHFIQQIFVCILQNQLRQSTEGNLLAVIQVMTLFNAGQAIMDCMCACQSAALKSDAGKEGVGLNDLPHCRCTYILLHSQFCLDTFFDQSIVTCLCQSHG